MQHIESDVSIYLWTFSELTAQVLQISLEFFSENKSKSFDSAIHFTANADIIGSIFGFFTDLKSCQFPRRWRGQPILWTADYLHAAIWAACATEMKFTSTIF